MLMNLMCMWTVTTTVKWFGHLDRWTGGQWTSGQADDADQKLSTVRLAKFMAIIYVGACEVHNFYLTNFALCIRNANAAGKCKSLTNCAEINLNKCEHGDARSERNRNFANKGGLSGWRQCEWQWNWNWKWHRKRYALRTWHKQAENASKCKWEKR